MLRSLVGSEMCIRDRAYSARTDNSGIWSDRSGLRTVPRVCSGYQGSISHRPSSPECSRTTHVNTRSLLTCSALTTRCSMTRSTPIHPMMVCFCCLYGLVSNLYSSSSSSSLSSSSSSSSYTSVIDGRPRKTYKFLCTSNFVRSHLAIDICPSVCLSVCQTRVLWQNKST